MVGGEHEMWCEGQTDDVSTAKLSKNFQPHHHSFDIVSSLASTTMGSQPLTLLTLRKSTNRADASQLNRNYETIYHSGVASCATAATASKKDNDADADNAK